MGDPNGDTQGCLPVTLELVAPEVKVPAGDTVEFAEDTLPAKLAGSGLGLLGGGEFEAVAQHIDARQLEAPVGPHGFA